MADKKQKQKKPSTFASLKQRWSGYRLKSQISKTVSRVEAGKDVSTVEATRAAGIIDAKTKRKQKQLNTAQAKVNNIKGQYSKKIRNNILFVFLLHL